MENKKSNSKIVVLISIIVVLALTLFGIKLFYNNFNLESKYSSKLISMSKDFYTNFYYNAVAKSRNEKEIKEFLGKFEENGVTIDLATLEKYKKEYKKEIKEFKNKKGESCDKINSYALIYPKSPYNKNSYKIKVKLDCNFKSSKK